MTDIERVEQIYDLVLSLVVTGKKVTVKTNCYSVNFSLDDDVYYMTTKRPSAERCVSAESETLHSLYDLAKHSIADHALCDDIEILVNDKLFAVIK